MPIFDRDLSRTYGFVSDFRLYIYFYNISSVEIFVLIYNAALNAVLYCIILEVCFILLSYSLAFAIASAILKASCSFCTISLS